MKTITATLVAAAIGLCLLTPAVRAQEARKQPPLDIKKFEMFVGKWQLDETDELCPFGPAGKFTCDTEIQFVQNGFAVEERGKGTGESAPATYSFLYFYDSTARTLRSVYCNNDGLTILAECAFEGDSLKSRSTQTADGKVYQCRNLWTAAPDRKSFKYEWTYSEDGVTWKTVCKGTGKKVGGVERTPGPEIKKFEMLIGKWRMEERDEDSPFGPSGRGSYDTEIRSVQNGFAVEERGGGTFRPDRGESNHYTYAFNYFYDPAGHRIATQFYDSAGFGGVGEGTFEGRTWRCQWTQEANGKNYQCRNVTTVASDGRTFDYEYSYSEDGATWKTCYKGTATKTGDVPKTPGPEHKKMEISAGRWEFEGDEVESPLGTAGKWRGTVESRMILGGFCLENRGHAIGPEGESDSLEIISYDPDRSVYRSTWFDSKGEFDKLGQNATATIEGNTWHFSWQQEKSGKKYYIRQKVTFTPDGKNSTWETSYSDDGFTWKKFSEAKVKKIGDVVDEKRQSAKNRTAPANKQLKLGDVVGGRRPSAKEAVAAANKEFEEAFNKGDAATIADQYTEDAQMFNDHEAIIRGKEAIEADWRKATAEFKGATATDRTLDVQESGDWAFETGKFVLTGRDGNILLDKKYLLVWKFEDGKWRIYRDIANDNPPSGAQGAKTGIPEWHRRYDELAKKGDIAALGMLFTEDAELYTPGEPTIRGRAAIRQGEKEWTEKIRSGGVKVEVKDIEIKDDGDTAFNIAKFTETGPDGKLLDEGFAVGFWKREGGEWRLHRDAWIPTSVTATKVGDLPKTPGPEHKKLEVWVGDWAYEGEAKASPFGAAGKMKGKESSKMILDGFFWEDHWQDETNSGEAGHGIIYLRYDPETRTYVDYTFGNDGSFGSTTNTVNGNVWTGLGTQSDSNGKAYKTRFLRVLSADGRKIEARAEYSADDGKSWMTWWELTNRKVSK